MKRKREKWGGGGRVFISIFAFYMHYAISTNYYNKENYVDH